MATGIRYRDSIFGLDPGQQNLLWCNTFFLCDLRQRFIEGTTRHLCDWTGNQRKNQYYLWSVSFYTWQPTGVHHKPLWQFHGPYRSRWPELDRGKRMDWALSIEEGEVSTILLIPDGRILPGWPPVWSSLRPEEFWAHQRHNCWHRCS